MVKFAQYTSRKIYCVDEIEMALENVDSVICDDVWWLEGKDNSNQH